MVREIVHPSAGARTYKERRRWIRGLGRRCPFMTLRRLISSGHAALANDDEGSPEQGVSVTRMGNIRSYSLGSASNWRPIGRTRPIIDGVTTPWQREHR